MRKILLINANPEALKGLKLALRGVVAEILDVDSGLDGLQYIQRKSVDLIISDIEIGQLDGWKLTRLIRSGIYKCDKLVPIIIVTQNWSERIAEITARDFEVNHLISFESRNQLANIAAKCLGMPAGQISAPRILAIEDNKDNAYLIDRILSPKYDVEIAGDGVSGLQAWKEKQHELVLLDIMLPNMHGEEVLEEILKINPQQPVVVITAHGTIQMAEELMIKGAIDFVAKPFRAEMLRRVCDLAHRREDYMVSNRQFEARLRALELSSQTCRKMSQQHQGLLDNLRAAIVKLDSRGTLRFVSEEWIRVTGHSVRETQGKKLSFFLSQQGRLQARHYSQKLRDLVSKKVDKCEFEIPLLNSSGRIVWFSCRFNLVESGNTEEVILGCLYEITEAKQQQQQLDYQSNHDDLTGARNLSCLERTLDHVGAEIDQGDGQHILLSLDLTNFKEINLQFGRQHGNLVLQDIVFLLQSCLKRPGEIYRIGGSQLAVLMLESDVPMAFEYAKNVLVGFEEYTYNMKGQNLEVSGCVGICQVDGSALRPVEYLIRVDLALQKAKSADFSPIQIYQSHRKTRSLQGRDIRCRAV